MPGPPQRTCIACGRKGERADFWRFKSHGGAAPVFDRDGRAPGRGASVCQSAICLEKAIARRAFERALKLQQPLSDGFKDELRQLNAESRPPAPS